MTIVLPLLWLASPATAQQNTTPLEEEIPLDPVAVTQKAEEKRELLPNATAATDPDLEKDLFLRCAGRNGNQRLEPDEQKGYVYGISSEIFGEFDSDCSGSLDEAETQRYVDKQAERLRADLKRHEEKIALYAERSVNNSGGRGTLNKKQAERIEPAIVIDKMTLAASAGVSSPPGTRKESGKLEFKIAQTPIKTFRTAIPTRLGLDWGLSAGREKTRTSAVDTRTDDVTFTPLSYTLMGADKTWSFKLSAGGAYLWSETRTLSTGEMKEEDGLTIAYVGAFEYQRRSDSCFKYGVKYELKQKHLFSDKVSSKLEPTITADFLCLKERSKSSN